MKSIFLGLLLVIVSPQIKAQNNISVPFVDGFIGVRGNNTQSADNIQNFSTLGIERVYFSQNSSGNIFEVQGNDIVGTITLVSSVTGQTLDVPGAIVWRITSGSTLEILGFIPAVGNPVANLSSIGLTSYQLDSDSNYGLKLVSSSFLLVDGTNISGNAASTGLLTALNNYLIEVQQNAPLGPVTVDDLTTTDSTPTISGTVNLASGEIFSVVVNGQTFDSANGVSIDGTNWMLTLPQTNLGTYSISAFITNTASFTLSAIGSLTIQDCQTANDVPAPPISGGDITSCETIAAQSLVATASVNTGESITWYDAATGGNLVADPSLSTPGTVTYFAEATNDTSGCVGQTRTAVTLTIEAAPSAPTGDSEQTFCDAATIADFTATGDNIQWYDAATGGNLLDSTTALADGQMVYASQTVNGCESNDRLEVTVSIQDINITASATEVCAGESVDLNVNVIGSNFSNWNTNEPNNNNGNEHVGMLVENAKWNDHRASNSNPDFLMESDTNLGVLSGFNFLGAFEGHFYYQSTTNSTWTNANSTATSLGGYLLILNSQAENDFIAQTSNITVHGSWIGMYQDTNHPDYSEPGGAWFWGDGTAVTMSSNPPTYTWSTGDTSETISVTPTETTEYWVDVTTNGVTCREYVTINVTAPAAPTGNAEQTFCEASTVADLTATGDNIQWYDAATGGNLLDSTTALTDGQIVYASQTVNGCESTDRLEVTVSIQEITITASATEVCAGEQVDLSVSATVTATNIVHENNFDTGAGALWTNGITSTFVSHPEYGDILGTFQNQNQPQFNLTGLDNGQYNVSFDLLIIATWDGSTSPTSSQAPDILTYNLNGQNIFDATFSNISTDWGWAYSCPQSFPENFGNGTFPAESGGGQLISLWPNWQIDNGCSLPQGGGGGISKYIISNEVIITDGNLSIQLQSSTSPGGAMCDESWAIDNLIITQSNAVSYLWSTGDTTETISVTPTETTEYWVDVTTNGVTCREYVTINVTAPAAPTGDAEQTFCDAATVADLTATGENIQWYDAATGGNLLNSTTALTDGQMVYASQTINGCESTDRLEVTVSIQDITITASATEVCAGESVDLSVFGDVNSTYLWSTGESNFSGQGTLVDEYSLVANTVSQNTFSIIPGNNYWLEVSGTINLGGGAGNQRDVAYYIQTGADGTIEGTPFASACNVYLWTSLFCDTPGLRPTPDIYDASTHTYNYPFTANASTLVVGFWDAPLGDNGANVVTFKLYELSNSESTITVTPTDTTEYWVDITTNGVTCREYITISVNDVPAPPISGGDITSCETLNAQNLVATASVNTGESITWYDAITGGSVVADPSLSTPGTVTYFAEATNDTSGCVGQARTAVTLTIEAAPDAPISGGDISECETIAAQSLVATALAEAGESITWYDAATGGNLVADPSLSTPGTVTYFAEATNDSSGCSSLSRTAVTLTITSVAAPTGEAVQSFCDNVTVSDLSANGTSLQWYDAPTAGNLLNSSYALSDGEMVYVSQTDNGCESVSRLEISVEIDVIPDPILLTTEIEFCIEAEVLLSDIEIDTQGFNLVWYDSYASGTVLPSDTLLEDQVSYFAALVDPSSSCESLNRLEYVPSIIPCEVFVYNALSLNDNGLNDHMVIEGSEYFPENTLQIFNRDGHLVYEKDQYGTGDNLFRGIANVNGIYRSGSKMPTGSYLYVFRYFNPYQQKEFIKKGFLMINSN